MTSNTKQYIVVMEVSHIVTTDELHELLCKGIHEQDQDALNDLLSTIHNIQIVGEIEETS